MQIVVKEHAFWPVRKSLFWVNCCKLRNHDGMKGCQNCCQKLSFWNCSNHLSNATQWWVFHLCSCVLVCVNQFLVCPHFVIVVFAPFVFPFVNSFSHFASSFLTGRQWQCCCLAHAMQEGMSALCLSLAGIPEQVSTTNSAVMCMVLLAIRACCMTGSASLAWQCTRIHTATSTLQPMNHQSELRLAIRESDTVLSVLSKFPSVHVLSQQQLVRQQSGADSWWWWCWAGDSNQTVLHNVFLNQQCTQSTRQKPFCKIKSTLDSQQWRPSCSSRMLQSMAVCIGLVTQSKVLLLRLDSVWAGNITHALSKWIDGEPTQAC